MHNSRYTTTFDYTSPYFVSSTVVNTLAMHLDERQKRTPQGKIPCFIVDFLRVL